MHPFPFIASVAIRAALVFAAAFLAASILRRASASARYFVWTCAFGAVLLLPLLMSFWPEWTLRFRTPVLATAPVIHDSITVHGSHTDQGTWHVATLFIAVWARR